MATSMNLSGLYVDTNATDAVRKLSELNGRWAAAHADRDTVWEYLRGSAYDATLVDRFNAKSDLCSMLEQRIIQHKRKHHI